MINYKRCNKCNNYLPATIEYFYRRNNRKSGLQSACKDCCKKQMNEHSITIRNVKNEYNMFYSNTINGHLRKVFSNIKRRCENINSKDYKYYGGRGIKCKFESAKEFIDYVLSKLEIDPRKLECDRIDNNGDYEKGNIRFVSHKENCQNTRSIK